MFFNPSLYRYPSRRMVVFAQNGMVAASTPQAAQAGLEILMKGGNAIDAAIAAAVTETVCEPCSNGIGSDTFMIAWSQGKLHGLNASGPSPQKQTLQSIKEKHTDMPRAGWVPANVPGAPAAWVTLNERLGRLPFAEVLKPAIRYAEHGFAVAPMVGSSCVSAYHSYKTRNTGPEFRGWFEAFAPGGKPMAIGDLVQLPDHARTLQLIADTKGEAFYRGEIAEKIVAFAQETGGSYCLEDFGDYQPEWVEPVSINYRGYDVYEIPPNGQGIVALMALNILKGFELQERENADTYHLMIEAIKLAFADGRKYITDSRFMRMPVEALLSEEYAAKRRALIGQQARPPEPGDPYSGGTIYLCAADNEGNMISLIQSNYGGFGSGIVVPGTGVALNNRGNNFTLDEEHANVYAPGKRPYNTIIPGFLMKDGAPLGPFGVMGGFMQPQGHLQMVVNTVDYQMNPQESLDAPRFQWTSGQSVDIEQSAPLHVQQLLARRGHNLTPRVASGGFGRGQIIWLMPNGALAGGTEPRTDGTIMGW
ncbi:MAG: gamma-glutamyltransferase family protein [Symbiobacteriaceae bacterium]|nr:gamma-glutamyltransferase family protein [Symbiobacteriaceae bacterium]